MARPRAPRRAARIIDAAVDLFMRRGYAATRMEMVAEAAGVAPGTLYLYAGGKEALFDLALRAAFEADLPDPDDGPHRLDARASVITSTWELVRERARFPRLEHAATLPAVEDVRSELRGVVEEFYDWLARYWRGVRMVERCALEWPELSTFFYRELRRGGLARLERYLTGRAAEGRLRPLPDAAVGARAILETVSFFAMHRHTAPDSAEMEDDSTRETVLTLLMNGLLP